MFKNDDVIQSQAVSLRALENQVGQIANAMNLRPQKATLSETKNSRSQGKKHCKAITLRSGSQSLNCGLNENVMTEQWESSDRDTEEVVEQLKK